MRNLVLRVAFLGAVLTLGACADNPAQSDQQREADLAAAAQDEQVTPQGCVADGGVCQLPPERGGWCDPYEELDFSCDDDGQCMTSVGDPRDVTVQGCPGDGDAGGGYEPPPGGADPGTPPPATDSIPDCVDCNPPEEESTICPQPFLGNVQPALITIAGRNHEFSFSSTPTYPFTRLTGGRSPATYEIGLPTTSRDAWWIAQAGTITVWCRGAWITRKHWVGTLTVVDSDLHMVMGPGHPDF